MKVSTSDTSVLQIDVDGIIIGSYENDLGEAAASKITDALSPILDLGDDYSGKFKENLLLYNAAGVIAKRVMLVGLGKKEKVDHEKVRVAVALGAKALRKRGVKKIAVEAVGGDAQSTAEGVLLGLYRFDELKTQDLDKLKTIDEVVYCGNDADWNKGVNIAVGENHARRLAELPSNYATPTYVATHSKEILEPFGVKVLIHDEKWAEEKKMGSFLSVTEGADEPAKFTEMQYYGGTEGDQPLVLVGKGITFDTGGTSIKPSAGMGLMRGDMGGAAAVIGAMYAIASLKIPINVIALTPLAENVPGAHATNPADVVTASNGKTIQVENTDAEGRLILADALVYAETFNPHTVIDLATLTGSMMIALGDAFIGAFTRSDDLWKELDEAGNQTYERFWRMPLDKKYRKLLDTPLADMNNVGGRAGGASTAAMFLGEFIEMERWAHIDIAGVGWTTAVGDYTPKGMTGMPVRALAKLAEKYIK